MDGNCSSQSQSLTTHRFESKGSVGEKRGSIEIEEPSEDFQRRVKMRELESVFRSEAQSGRGESKEAHPDVYSDSRALDINIDDPMCVGESNNPLVSCKKDVQRNDGLDVNAADISSSINDLFYPYKTNEHLKARDDSDCVSSVGPMEGRDPMSVWKGLKQNNYMSTTYGSVPIAIPKVRGRKKSSHHDVMKKKIELAKKEQVDRFARVAAPSGLLNGLNPGIINHVRNSKQVHSIIEALVRSERSENLLSRSKKCDEIKSGAQELIVGKESSYGDALPGRMQASDFALFSKSIYSNTRDGDSTVHEDDKFPLKLSSSLTLASENASCVSNGECSVSSLSLKAANVASQWLELLNQDIKGRIAALRRSKKRVRAVIATELPLLMSREFSSDSKKAACTTTCSSATHFDQEIADAHYVKWNTVFAQMDKALSEEENHLENWLNQVKELQLHCEMGLDKNILYHASQQITHFGNDNRSGTTENSEKDLAIRAAAASIYSTCNFLLSRENTPCS